MIFKVVSAFKGKPFIRGNFLTKNMGGAKKPRPAKQEKAQNPKDSKKAKKSEGGPKKAEITVIINEEQALKDIQGSKVITAYELARQMGTKISAANAFLRNAQKKGTINKVGGYSGHHIYQTAST